jgi:hypothetical protein
MNEYQLSPIEAKAILELQQAVALSPPQQQLEGALKLIAAQQGLAGSLRLNGTVLQTFDPTRLSPDSMGNPMRQQGA